MSNNPFSDDYVRKIDMSDISRAAKSSHQQSAQVNKRRAAGVEPNKVNLPGSMDTPPQKFTVKLPSLPKYKRPPRTKKP